jgi:hypothetical protein
MTLVHTDARGRLSLGKLIQADRDYRVSASEQGTLLLEPVTVISDYEKKVLENTELVAALDAALATPTTQYVRRSRKGRA